MVERLTLGPTSVSKLAEPLAMSLAAVVQHVQVLEACGVVRTEKAERTRMCRIEPAAMTAAEQWITDRRRGWETRLSGRSGRAHPSRSDVPGLGQGDVEPRGPAGTGGGVS